MSNKLDDYNEFLTLNNLTENDIAFDVYVQLVTPKTFKSAERNVFEIDVSNCTQNPERVIKQSMEDIAREQHLRSMRNLNEYGQRIINVAEVNREYTICSSKDVSDSISGISDVIVDLTRRLVEMRNYRFREGIKRYYTTKSLIQEHSVINLSTFRQTGGTTAIARMFDPKRDVLITYSFSAVQSFADTLKNVVNVKSNKSVDFKYMLTSSYNNDRLTNNTIKLINDTITEFFKEKTIIEGIGADARLVSSGSLRKAVEMLGTTVNQCVLPDSMRGRSIDGTSIIWIDGGGSTALYNSVAIERIINAIFAFLYRSGSDEEISNITFPMVVIV